MKEMVCLVKVVYEDGSIAWCQPMCCVFMGYEDTRRKTPGNVFKSRATQGDSALSLHTLLPYTSTRARNSTPSSTRSETQ